MSSNFTLYNEILASQNFFFRSMSVACFENDGILATCMGIENSFFNNVLETNVTKEKLHTTIQALEEFFAGHNVPWTWLVFPSSRPFGLDQLLQSHGMAEIESFAVMGMDMTKPLPKISGETFAIKEVKNSKDFDAWDIPEQEGFGGTNERMAQFRKQTENIPYGEGNNFHHYVLYEDSMPIAAGTLSLHKGNARLDNIAARPAYQKKGFGTAITNHMLFEAKRLGAKYCFLDASREGAAIYKKLGFQEYYTGRMYGFLPEVAV